MNTIVLITSTSTIALLVKPPNLLVAMHAIFSNNGYSLAIGSSHCIHCPNNNNLALLNNELTSTTILVWSKDGN